MTHTVLSPAKVNLFLKVVSKRPDGYHNIVSIVDIISVFDVIHIEEIPDDVIIIEDDKDILPKDAANTMYRAAVALKERFKINRGVRVFVEKNIPIGSGLGGPSSNAATVLKELARIWKVKINEAELNDIGRGIGADVPLFLYGNACIMRGIGNKISPVELPSLWYLIIYPNISISTRRVYEGLKIVLTKKQNDIKLVAKFSGTREVSAILENDLERIGILLCPIIKTIKDRLIESGASGTLMSGSGSSVFGIFENEEGAKQASASLTNMGKIFIARSVKSGGSHGGYGC
ncbi:MAG TPA: 4-(cytidine 5'-diphospho)-2-C-methyl-D-erythritol kinase [Syntrophorhabdus sp.]|jgi:4-diphosphocytidyl-2-C-methyl-D-erythritol kinase|nr:4-(cytidine 5'-diphospho)-2-C-methyl-D-erythritol kinase [Syntrophorhabdus sp.]OPX95570.1 MAG: 4-diphosphocytidyl-2-C-methyl-D-erythritol kinase [Syntrophorhabdus sp. PtaB.Bin027]HNS78207.1 4-(cytidine 5'-diphospho)-2-C-methyl-D-erythritol kinase [Syntrophorhabdus sp.]HQG26163.1 4-(cytidine 5'-diphospho)-2-C-methyl-D-erythritol kinase [Syntrophorhabdus sp.]HQI96805.1 4-(cytidine 5'-diphospho)-2-C-methyl-D-erythritol kinase [Syntrophorhabdus sp.]